MQNLQYPSTPHHPHHHLHLQHDNTLRLRNINLELAEEPEQEENESMQMVIPEVPYHCKFSLSLKFHHCLYFTFSRHQLLITTMEKKLVEQQVLILANSLVLQRN
jgi:hypothetical protein